MRPNEAKAEWFAVVDKATGEAVSFGTQLPDELPPNLEAIAIEAQPDKDTRWDAGTRKVVARPVVGPVDRVAELLADPVVSAITAKLTAGERAALEEKLRRLA